MQPRRSAAAVAHRHTEHLVEVAVEQITLPVDGDQRTAHDLFEILVAVRRPQPRHVVGKLALGNQRAAEARDRHVGERVEPVEHDAEVLAELALVIGLELRLRRRQRWPLRVVDEVQRQVAAGEAVTQRVEALQSADALVEDAVAALPVDVFHRIAG